MQAEFKTQPALESKLFQSQLKTNLQISIKHRS